MRRGYPDFLPEDVALVDFATLRRNLKSRHFPGRNPREDETVAASIADALAAAAPGKSRRGRLALSTFLGGSVPGATVLPVPGMEAAVVVNNRDHLSIQGYAGGIELKRAFATADALESALSKGTPPFKPQTFPKKFSQPKKSRRFPPHLQTTEASHLRGPKRSPLRTTHSASSTTTSKASKSLPRTS